MPNKPEEFIPTRRSLLTRLKQWDDQESWRDFFNTYWKLVYGVALKSGLSDAEAQEVVQETVISVAKKMHDFKYDPAVGSFKSWLLLLTRRRIADQFRKRPRESGFAPQSSDATTRTAAIARIPDPESLNMDALWDEEWQRNIVNAAIERVKRRVAPKQFQIFELYVVKEWPAERVTKTLGVSATQVYLAKLRIGKLIRKEAAKLEAQML
jgi:RNA polymerase sigma-70 factor (ECF subfamily)